MEISTILKNINKKKINNIYLIIDRLKISIENSSRITDSIELVLQKANKKLIILKENTEFLFSQTFSCLKCGIILKNQNQSYFLLITLLEQALIVMELFKKCILI